MSGLNAPTTGDITISSPCTSTSTAPVRLILPGPADTTAEAQLKINSAATAMLQTVVNVLDEPTWSAVPNPALSDGDLVPVLRERYRAFLDQHNHREVVAAMTSHPGLRRSPWIRQPEWM